MVVTEDVFKKLENMLYETVIDRNRGEHAVWIILALFSVKWSLNGAQEVPGDGALESQQLPKLLKSNKESHQTYIPDSPLDSTQPHILALSV